MPRATITMSNHRIERVSELVKREVSEIVLELNLTDCGFVTITAAEISPDLKEGRIFVSVIGSAEQKQRALARCSNASTATSSTNWRTASFSSTRRACKFVLDETEDRASHIEHLLDELEGGPSRMTDAANRLPSCSRSQNRFLVLTHYRPDGDAVGSQLALVLLLKSLGKQVEAWNDDDVPAKFRFLPHSDLITRPPAEPKDFDVVIAIDTSTWQRVGTAAQRIRNKKHFVNIDHHVSNEKFAEINWIVPEAPASGQIAFDLIKRGGFTLTREIATCLFAAISTDTGSFSYGNTTAESLRVAAELVETGLNVGEICRHMYESYPYARLHAAAEGAGRSAIGRPQPRRLHWVTNEMFEESGAKREDTEGLIDYARAIEGVLVAILFEEMASPARSASACARNIRKSTSTPSPAAFGGGGHREAAGARITGEPHEIEAKVLAAVSEALAAARL